MGKKKDEKPEEKIRIHNKSRREYQIPPTKKGGKMRKIEPGRAIEVEESLGNRLIKAYPRDLINFENLVSGDRKDIKKENKKLESQNKSLAKQNEDLLARIEALEEASKGKKDPNVTTEQGA